MTTKAQFDIYVVDGGQDERRGRLTFDHEPTREELVAAAIAEGVMRPGDRMGDWMDIYAPGDFRAACLRRVQS